MNSPESQVICPRASDCKEDLVWLTDFKEPIFKQNSWYDHTKKD